MSVLGVVKTMRFRSQEYPDMETQAPSPVKWVATPHVTDCVGVPSVCRVGGTP